MQDRIYDNVSELMRDIRNHTTNCVWRTNEDRFAAERRLVRSHAQTHEVYNAAMQAVCNRYKRKYYHQ